MAVRYHSECRSHHATPLCQKSMYSPRTRSPSPFHSEVRRGLFVEEANSKSWYSNVRCSHCFIVETDLAKARAQNRLLEDEIRLLRRNSSLDVSLLQSRVDNLAVIEVDYQALLAKYETLQSQFNRKFEGDETASRRIQLLEQDAQGLLEQNRVLERELANKAKAEDNRHLLVRIQELETQLIDLKAENTKHAIDLKEVESLKEELERSNRTYKELVQSYSKDCQEYQARCEQLHAENEAQFNQIAREQTKDQAKDQSTTKTKTLRKKGTRGRTAQRVSQSTARLHESKSPYCDTCVRVHKHEWALPQN